MYFCHSWFSNMVSFRYVLVVLSFLHDIFSLKFYAISFLWDFFTISFTIFLLMKNVTRWMLDTEVKVFHESISWNDPETVFHKMPWKKNFTVYPSLKNINFEEYLRTTASVVWCESKKMAAAEISVRVEQMILWTFIMILWSFTCDSSLFSIFFPHIVFSVP